LSLARWKRRVPRDIRKKQWGNAAEFAEALDRSKVVWTALSDKAPELICRPRGSSKIST